MMTQQHGRPGSGVNPLTVIQRLEVLIDQESDALRRHQTASMSDLVDRKSQGLLELSHALRSLDAKNPSVAVVEGLAGLRKKLEVNQYLLKCHLDAVGEVSLILSQAIREADSDGTYTPYGRRGSTR
jgi:hypothetical protein